MKSRWSSSTSGVVIIFVSILLVLVQLLVIHPADELYLVNLYLSVENLFQKGGNWQEGLEKYEQILRSEDASPFLKSKVRLNSHILLRILKRDAEAEQVLRTILEEDQHYVIIAEAARALAHSRKDLVTEITALRAEYETKILDTTSPSSKNRNRFIVACIMLYGQDEHDTAIKIFRDISNSNLDKRAAAGAQYEIGLWLFFKKDYEDAINEFAKVKGDVQTKIIAELKIAFCYILSGDGDKAAAKYSALLEKYPTEWRVKHAANKYLGYHCLKNNEYDKTLEYFEKFTAEFPDSRWTPQIKLQKDAIKKESKLK